MTSATSAPNGSASIIRTEQGLTIAGTRITLDDVMDHLVAGWTPKLIGSWFMIVSIKKIVSTIVPKRFQNHLLNYIKLVLQSN